jgi:hypothetical protein
LRQAYDYWQDQPGNYLSRDLDRSSLSLKDQEETDKTAFRSKNGFQYDHSLDKPKKCSKNPLGLTL